MCKLTTFLLGIIIGSAATIGGAFALEYAERKDLIKIQDEVRKGGDNNEQSN